MPVKGRRGADVVNSPDSRLHTRDSTWVQTLTRPGPAA